MSRIIPNIHLVESSVTETEGKFSYGPLAPGYGITLGNSLRRVLLSSVPGYYIRHVSIDGASHKYSILSGMQEDVIHFIQNLKQVRFKLHSDFADKVRLRIDTKGPGPVSSKSIYCPDDPGMVTVLEDVYLCTLNQDAVLKCELFVERGHGYVDATTPIEGQQPGRIAINNIANAVTKVTAEVENTRFGEHTDYEILNLTIKTDGSINPLDALKKASDLLCTQLRTIAGGSYEVFSSSNNKPHDIDDSVLLKSVADIGLSDKTVAALYEFGIKTVKDLANCTESYLFSIPRFGRRKVQDIQAALAPLRLTLKDASIFSEKDV